LAQPVRVRGAVVKHAKILRCMVFFSLLPAVAACASGTAAVKNPPSVLADAPESGGFSVATFNAGLAHGAIPFVDERRTLIADTLNELATDVLCLQEVWTDEDAAALILAVKPAYPFSFRMETTGNSPKTAKCGLFKALKLNDCVESQCTRKGTSVFECVEGPCKERYEALGDECRLCLAANPDQSWRCASGLFRSDEFVYDGSNGLLLLSRHRIERPKYTAFDTVLIKRGVISATIAGRTVICTHLTADLAAVPYPGGRSYSSFKEEQADQLAWIATASPTDGCVIVLGDFNTGPASETLTGEHPEHYASILAEGFIEPWSARRCTLCRDNSLAGSPGDLQIDHILVRQCADGDSLRYSRILDRVHDLGKAGGAHEAPLSDHYGLRLDWEDTRPDHER